MVDIGIPYALADLIAIRGVGWLSDGIAACEGNTDYPSHIAGMINPDPSICLEALTRVKTNPLDKTLAGAKRAWLIHVKDVTDAQRAAVVYDACSFSADNYGWSDILLQGLDSETHETWWTDKLAGELAKSPICSYVWAHAWATAGIAFGPKLLSSVTPADVYLAALADPSRFDVSEIILG